MTGMNQATNFMFWFTNTSTTDIFITHTESSCDCTVAKLPSQPWMILPGESFSLDVKMNLMGRHGRVTKEVLVVTSHGSHILKVHADIPLTPAPFNVAVSARQQDVAVARKDRQAVFQGSCAACHALPTVDRTGEALFAKACGICHLSRQRADFVPDLATLKHPTGSDYWRNWITHGKEGTLMPAFARSARGILDTNQIESLVEYLLGAYPAKTTAASSNTTSAASALPK
jgi:mono/diheme cytochrome c family protein